MTHRILSLPPALLRNSILQYMSRCAEERADPSSPLGFRAEDEHTYNG